LTEKPYERNERVMPKSSADISLTLVVACARNRVIGRDGELPWRLSTDLKRFKALTFGRPVLMGRKTWASIGRPLPGRANLVLTRDTGFQALGGWVFSDLATLLAAGRAMAAVRGEKEVCVIGGGEIYAATIGLADKVELTFVDAEPDGDAVFPPLETDTWREASRTAFSAGEKDDHSGAFVTYLRS
jgi:dihydrofolate reductase